MLVGCGILIRVLKIYSFEKCLYRIIQIYCCVRHWYYPFEMSFILRRHEINQQHQCSSKSVDGVLCVTGSFYRANRLRYSSSVTD